MAGRLLVASPAATFRAARRKRRLTQRRLAAAAGLTPESLCRFERGRDAFSVTTRLVLWLLIEHPWALAAAEEALVARDPGPPSPLTAPGSRSRPRSPTAR